MHIARVHFSLDTSHSRGNSEHAAPRDRSPAKGIAAAVYRANAGEAATMTLSPALQAHDTGGTGANAPPTGYTPNGELLEFTDAHERLNVKA